MKKSILWFLLIYTVVRIVFLPFQHTGDGWGYACEIIKGDLFSPHHILYKPLLYLVYKALLALHLNINPIQIFSLINILLGSFTLLIFYKLLNHIKPLKQLNFWLTFLVAFTFGFLRYSSENETYILPLLMSLLGTFYYSKGRLNLGIFFMTVAVLCHQIHIFWLLAFLIPQKNKPYSILPGILSVGSLVLCYVLYAKIYNTNWYSLPFYDVNQGLVTIKPGMMNFIMTPISFIRTFFQLHGSIKDLFIDHPFNFIFILMGILCVFIFLINSKGILHLIKRFIAFVKKPRINFRNPLFIAIILHFSFAFYSVGNAEFMVMLPFLLILWQYERIVNLSVMFIHYIGMSLLIWNFSFFVIPTAFYDTQGMQQKLNEIQKIFNESKSSHCGNAFVSDDNIPLFNFKEYLELTSLKHYNFSVISFDEYTKKMKTKHISAITDRVNNNGIYDRKSISGNIGPELYKLATVFEYNASEFPHKEVILSKIIQ
jgi:hypothetical protein